MPFFFLTIIFLILLLHRFVMFFNLLRIHCVSVNLNNIFKTAAFLEHGDSGTGNFLCLKQQTPWEPKNKLEM